MASYFKLILEERKNMGGSSARGLRRNGKIPVNYYYKDQDNLNFIIDQKVLHQAIQTGQHVFEISINDETVYVMIKDAQYNPITEQVIHIDLMRVRRTENMTLSLPIVLEGVAAGSVEGGIVTQAATSIDIECFPTNVPESLIVDISGLELNSVISAAEIDLPEDVSLVSSEQTTIASCNPPKVEAEPEPEELEGDEEDMEGEGEGEAPKAEGEGEAPKAEGEGEAQKDNESDSQD